MTYKKYQEESKLDAVMAIGMTNDQLILIHKIENLMEADTIYLNRLRAIIHLCDWLEETIQGRYTYYKYQTEMSWRFSNLQDAMLFKLRWL